MDPRLVKAMEATPPETLKGRDKPLNHFWYGEYGASKTITACYCAMAECQRLGENQKAILIATDSGTDSIYNHPELLDFIEVVPYSGLSQLRGIAGAVTEQLVIGDKDYGEYQGGIIVDTVSQIQEEYLDWLLDGFKFGGNLRERAVATPEAKRLGYSDQDITGMPDYHLARNNMRLPIKDLIKAPVDVYFLAHLREPSFMDQQKGKITKRPTVTEAVFKLIAREVSTLGLMERNGEKRTIKFETTKTSVSKSRIKELDNRTVNCDDLPEILQKWKVS
jgi:hypothetical protein